MEASDKQIVRTYKPSPSKAAENLMNNMYGVND